MREVRETWQKQRCLNMVRQIGGRTPIFFMDFQRLFKEGFSLVVPLPGNVESRQPHGG